MSRRKRLSAREKVDDVLKYLREEHDWSAGQFVAHFMTATSEGVHTNSPSVRRKRFVKQVQDEGLDWVAILQEAGVRFEVSGQLRVESVHGEMDRLISNSNYFGKWDSSVSPDDIDIVQATEDMISYAPSFFGFLKQVCAHERSQDSHGSSNNSAANLRILGMLSNMCNMYHRNNSNWLLKTLGVHFGNLGLKRRGIELLSVLGFCPSYKTINKDLDEIAELSRVELRTYGLDPTTYCGYDNFDYMEEVKHQIMGVAPRQRQLTTGRVFSGNKFLSPSGLLQKDFQMDAKLDFEDVFGAPGVARDQKSLEIASFHVSETLKACFPQVFESFNATQISQLPQITPIEPLEPGKTRSHVLDAIFANEGTTDGNLDVHEQIWVKQLNIPSDSLVYAERLFPVYGDQKTAHLCRAAKNLREGELDPFDSRRWLLPISAIFHWRQNRLWGIQKAYSGTVDTQCQSSLAFHMNFWKVLKVPLQKAPFHHLEELVLHSWDARIIAVLYRILLDEGIDIKDPRKVHSHLTRNGVNVIKQYISAITEEFFTYGAYTGANDVEDDSEYRTHVRFLQDVEAYKTMVYGVRHGDIGLIERCFNHSVFQCLGTGAYNYAHEMLHFRWLISAAARGNGAVRRAILAGGLVNLRGKSDSWMEIDYYIELLNGCLKQNLYDRRSSTHSIEVLLKRTAMTIDHLLVLRNSLEHSFGIRISPKHTRRTAAEQIHQLAYDLSVSSVRFQSAGRTTSDAGFEIPNIMQVGANAMYGFILSFNKDQLSGPPPTDPNAVPADMPNDAPLADLVEAVASGEAFREEDNEFLGGLDDEKEETGQ